MVAMVHIDINAIIKRSNKGPLSLNIKMKFDVELNSENRDSKEQDEPWLVHSGLG